MIIVSYTALCCIFIINYNNKIVILKKVKIEMVLIMVNLLNIDFKFMIITNICMVLLINNILIYILELLNY